MGEVIVRPGWVLESVSERSYAEEYPRAYTEKEARTIDPKRFVTRFNDWNAFSDETALGVVLSQENSGNFPKGSFSEHVERAENKELERVFLEEGMESATKRHQNTRFPQSRLT